MSAPLMTHVLAPIVDAVWRAVRDGAEPARPSAMDLFVDRFPGADLAPTYAVLDLIDDLGLRDLAHADGMLAAFGVTVMAAFARPPARLRMCVGTNHVALADVAGLLIRLERFGLAVDPGPLVDALRPALARKPLLTSAELAVWWHAAEQHRSEGVTLVAGDESRFVATETARTPGGYRAEAWISAEGKAVNLWVRSPRFRRRRMTA